MIRRVNLEGRIIGEHEGSASSALTKNTIIFDAAGAEQLKGSPGKPARPVFEEMMDGVFGAARSVDADIVFVGDYDQAVLTIKKIRHGRQLIESWGPFLYKRNFEEVIQRIFVLDPGKKAEPGDERSVIKDIANQRFEYSISRAMHLAKTIDAYAVVSPGDTGSTVLASTFTCKRLSFSEHHSEPIKGYAPITIALPIKHGPRVVLDMGSNADNAPTQENADLLLQFSVLGAAFYTSLCKQFHLQEQTPRIGLWSNGEEETKGGPLEKLAYRVLIDHYKGSDLFVGNIESNHIYFPAVRKDGSQIDPNVVVVNGLDGNRNLKTFETAYMVMGESMKKQLQKLYNLPPTAYLALTGFRGKLKKDLSSEDYGAAVCSGLNTDTVVMIGHSASNWKAAKNSLLTAERMKGIMTLTNQEIRSLYAKYGMK